MSDQSQFPKPDAPSTDISQKYDAELANPPPVEEVTGVNASDLKAGADERAQRRRIKAHGQLGNVKHGKHHRGQDNRRL